MGTSEVTSETNNGLVRQWPTLKVMESVVTKINIKIATDK